MSNKSKLRLADLQRAMEGKAAPPAPKAIPLWKRFVTWLFWF